MECKSMNIFHTGQIMSKKTAIIISAGPLYLQHSVFQPANDSNRYRVRGQSFGAQPHGQPNINKIVSYVF